MMTFEDYKLSKQVKYALDDLGLVHPTPIQDETFGPLMSGKNIIGISQTGTGKTIAFGLPIIQELGYSPSRHPRVVILVPTRELVLQVVEALQALATYKTIRIVGVYGGVNMNTQKADVIEGVDILVGTPGRLYDIVLHGSINLKTVRKLVIDEVDLMLDLGFRYQIVNILELLPERRQNVLFSATMTEEIEELIADFFTQPQKISIAVSGTPLDNIDQVAYHVPNFYTKANLLRDLVKEKDLYPKVLVFVDSKKKADVLYDLLSHKIGKDLDVVHSNKSQNRRIKALQKFDSGETRVLIATDLMARGIDLSLISHVICMDVPQYPENYLHRIGRTGRAEAPGKSILLYSPREEERKLQVEVLMNYEIPIADNPAGLEVSEEYLPEELDRVGRQRAVARNFKEEERGPAFHEKSLKNQKTNLGSKMKRKMAAKYKKPQTRGDKIQNMKAKKRKKR
jgi:ATP-dependent RNA helicase RhlE